MLQWIAFKVYYKLSLLGVTEQACESDLVKSVRLKGDKNDKRRIKINFWRNQF